MLAVSERRAHGRGQHRLGRDATSVDDLIVLVHVPQRATTDAAHVHPVVILDGVPEFSGQSGMLTGLASQPYVAALRACSSACASGGQPLSALLEDPSALRGHQFLDGFDQRRQRRLRIRGDRHVDFGVALEI